MCVDIVKLNIKTKCEFVVVKCVVMLLMKSMEETWFGAKEFYCNFALG